MSELGAAGAGDEIWRPWLLTSEPGARNELRPDSDAYLGADAPCPLHARTLAECVAVAERIEREALGSPIAQDAARRIRLAILALREERR